VSANDLQVVCDTVAFLHQRGAVTWLFGGWAEELPGIAGPRPHDDLDLLYPAEDFAAADALMGAGDWNRSPRSGSRISGPSRAAA